MTELPTEQLPPDDLEDRYRREAAADPSRPGERVQTAVFEHAARLAAQRGLAQRARIDARRPVARPARWRAAIFGTLAAAALAGLLVTPRFLTRNPPPAAPAAVAPEPAQEPPEAKGPPLASAPAPEAAPATQAPLQEPARLARQSTNASAPPLAKASAPPEFEPQTFAAQNAAPPAAATARIVPRSALTAAESADPAAAGAAGASVGAGAPSAADGSAAGRISPTPGNALRQAAESGNLERVRMLLKTPVDIDARDAHGRSALMLAVLRDRSAIVDALLAHDADPNAADDRGVTPLQAALAANQADIAAALRRAGAR